MAPALSPSVYRRIRRGNLKFWASDGVPGKNPLGCNGLPAHVATRISLFSKSHDCGQVIAHPQLAHLGPVRIPAWKGVFHSQSGYVPIQHSLRVRRRSGGTSVRLRSGFSPTTSTVRRPVALDWAVAGAVGPRHPTPFAIRLQPICWTMVTTFKHCNGWESAAGRP
jgi:hypothetical protein